MAPLIQNQSALVNEAQIVQGAGLPGTSAAGKTLSTVFSGCTSEAAATAGAATLPANPVGFIDVLLNGVLVKIPYYAA